MKFAVHLSACFAKDEGQDARPAIDVRQSGSSLAINAPAIRLVTHGQFILLPLESSMYFDLRLRETLTIDSQRVLCYVV